MDKEPIAKDFQQNSASSYEPRKTGVEGDEETLLRLIAKKRADSKRAILCHTIIYIIGYFISTSLYRTDFFRYNNYRKGFCVGFMVAWGLLLLLHIASYFSPYIGISPSVNILGRLLSPNYDLIEAEYKKLKEMEADRLADEYKRL